jgi:predicted transglutaminase-like cysteine proteinase
MEDRLLITLKRIHRKVLDRFTYKTDLEQYGENEKWVMPDSIRVVGDCEDFALACRRLCREEGINNSRLVVCTVETGEGHCVLEVDGWILDNRCQRVVSRDFLENKGYKWLAISGYSPGDDWHNIER